jgi:ATP-dependent protease Clp ATPase subunit
MGLKCMEDRKCSFCGKSSEIVKILIGTLVEGCHSDTFICDECIAVFNIICKDEVNSNAAKE